MVLPRLIILRIFDGNGYQVYQRVGNLENGNLFVQLATIKQG
jgi:hypothetical protein